MENTRMFHVKHRHCFRVLSILVYRFLISIVSRETISHSTQTPFF